jgi:hypothetical protein
LTAAHADELKAHIGDADWEASGLKRPDPKDISYDEQEAIIALTGMDDGIEGPVICGEMSGPELKEKLESFGFVHDPSVDAYLSYLMSIDAF